MPPQFPIPREEPTGPGYLNGGGHGGGGMPPGSTVAERLTRLEVQVEQNSGVLRHISGVVARVDDEQDKMFAAIVGIEKAISRIETGLDYTTEKTGKFEIAALEKELAQSKEKIAAHAAEAARRSGAITTLGIGLTLATITGIAAIIWQLIANH